MIEFASLGSGSRGNATLVRAGDTHLLVDCGLSLAETTRRITVLGVEPAQLDAILITHEHADHVKGAVACARRWRVPVFMTPATKTGRQFDAIEDLRFIEDYRDFQIGDFTVSPIPVAHDAADPVAYRFEHRGLRFGIVTDLGSYTQRVVDAFSDCHGLFLEANHDVSLLAQGPYPPFLKQRVGGAWGHLSNHQARAFFEDLGTEQLSVLALGHISEKNNNPALVREAFVDAVSSHCSMSLASQDEGLSWRTVQDKRWVPAEIDTF